MSYKYVSGPHTTCLLSIMHITQGFFFLLFSGGGEVYILSSVSQGNPTNDDHGVFANWPAMIDKLVFVAGSAIFEVNIKSL